MQIKHCSPTKLIWQVYDRNIHGICLQWLCIRFSSTLAGPPGLPGALCSGTHAHLADLLCFSNRESCNTRLRPAKNPQPSVDLIHLAASARYHGTTYSTYEILAWLRLLCLWFTDRPVKHAFTKVTYDFKQIIFTFTYITHDLLVIYWWFTYDIYLCFTNDLLMTTYLTYDLLVIYLWFTFDYLMITLWFTYDLLMIDLWLTYNHKFDTCLPMIYLLFAFD